ncbi:hypothetical protein [Gemella morbillorum]
MKQTMKKFKNTMTEIMIGAQLQSMSKKNKTIEKVVTFALMFVVTFAVPAFAAEGTAAIDSLISWLAAWVLKIGLIVAFFGGVQTALGFKNDDADGKVRGLKTLASGFMVAGIAKSLDLFGL